MTPSTQLKGKTKKHNIIQPKCPSTPLEHVITLDNIYQWLHGWLAEARNLSYATFVLISASLSRTVRVAHGRLKLRGCIIHVGLWLSPTSPKGGATDRRPTPPSLSENSGLYFLLKQQCRTAFLVPSSPCTQYWMVSCVSPVV